MRFLESTHLGCFGQPLTLVMNCALERQSLVVACSTHAMYWFNPLSTFTAIISGISYECIDRINFSSAAYRCSVVFTIRSLSRLFCIFPCQRKIDVTAGTIFTQADSFSFTTACPIFSASRRLDTVTRTMSNLSADLAIKSPTIQEVRTPYNRLLYVRLLQQIPCPT